MAIDPKDLGELAKALNDAAGKASALWTTFVIFELYLAITFGSVTHRNLFLEDPIKLPLLNVDLPLVGFFVVAPTILLILHFYVFLQLLALAKKAKDYDVLLRQEAPSESDRQYLRHRLDSFLVLQFLAGPAEQRTGFSGFSSRLIVWLTLVGVPVLILLQGQITFLPYHREWVAWLQRITVFVDLAVIWYFRNYVRGDEHSILARLPSGAWKVVNAAATACVALFSVCLTTFPGELAHEHLPNVRLIPTNWWLHWRVENDWTTLHELLFAGVPNEVTGRLQSPFSNRLVLTDQSFIDPDKLDKIEISRSFRGRDLRQAVLNRADLRKADFTSAMMNGAKLEGAKLQGARFGCAEKNEKIFGCAYLQGADLMGAQLQGADLEKAELQGANLSGLAKLQGAKLDGAQLQGASLLGAQLQGATLWGTQLQGAELIGVLLQGANLMGAHLEGAYLAQAELQGANLDGANLQGANLERAQLQGANFGGVSRRAAQLQGASLAYAKVWRTRGTPRIDLADLDLVDSNMKPWEKLGVLRATFAVWRADIIKDIPAGDLRDQAMMRLSALDPLQKKQPENVINANFWKVVPPPREERERRLSAFLAELACSRNSSVPYVARGLLQNGRMKTTGTQIATVADRLRKGKSDQTACPGVNGFTDKDWADLDQLASRPHPRLETKNEWPHRLADPSFTPFSRGRLRLVGVRE